MGCAIRWAILLCADPLIPCQPSLPGLYLRLPNHLLDSLVVAASSTYLRTSLPAFASLLPLQHLLSIAYLPLRVLSTTIIVDPSSFDTWNPFEALRRLAAKEEGGLWSLWTSRRYLQAAAVELVADCATDAVGVLVKRFCRWIRISFSNETISGQRTFNLFGYLANTFGGIVLVSAGVALMGLAMSNIQSRLQVSSGAYLSSSTRTKADKASSVEASEKVFLRSRPYAGVWDCATSVVREEGWQALFRGVREFFWMGVGFAGVCAVAILGICFWREEALVYLHGKVDRAAKEKREGDVLGLSRFLRPVDYHRSLQQL